MEEIENLLDALEASEAYDGIVVKQGDSEETVQLINGSESGQFIAEYVVRALKCCAPVDWQSVVNHADGSISKEARDKSLKPVWDMVHSWPF
ncbi:MAG: hypothetical protein AAF959_05315 [Cyanobacteria bacterium P01_D01_bin.56]